MRPKRRSKQRIPTYKQQALVRVLLREWCDVCWGNADRVTQQASCGSSRSHSLGATADNEWETATELMKASMSSTTHTCAWIHTHNIHMGSTEPEAGMAYITECSWHRAGIVFYLTFMSWNNKNKFCVTALNYPSPVSFCSFLSLPPPTPFRCLSCGDCISASQTAVAFYF